MCNDKSTLVIDAKYYSRTTQQNYGPYTVHSGNLYQIYLRKNTEAAQTDTGRKVSGLLLYARTDENVQPDGVYQMSGNQISVKTLDLNQPFPQIRAQLDAIAAAHFAEHAT